MRIALWNGSGLNNVGDRLIDAVTRRELESRLPSSQFQTFSPWPGSLIRDRLAIDLDGIWNGHGEFDAIVIGGGALITGPPFSDPCGQFFLFGPYPERFQDSALILWNSVCSDVQFLATTNEKWRAFVRAAVSHVSLLTVRNRRTSVFLQSCGVAQPINVVPDVAILAAEPTQRRSPVGRMQIGVAPGRPAFPDEFLTTMALNALTNASSINPEVMQAVNHSAVLGFDDEQYTATLSRSFNELAGVDLVVFGFGQMYGDPITAKLLAGKLRSSVYVPLSDPQGTDAVSLMRSLDCIVAFRLHACILALAVGTPFIAVDAYRERQLGTSKLHQFMGDAGFESRYLTLEDLVADGKRLHRVLEEVLADGSEPIVCAHSKLASGVRTHFDKMAEMLVNGADAGRRPRSDHLDA